ncbi:MAG: PD-(D/E)XK nuclease family protein [Actinobacteria bacterium]|nr:PD-(D/E)XK nuclease family protein [Actinomycetota bacterium]
MTVRRRCPREHRLSYELGYRAIEETEALRFGTMWHVGLELWWQGAGLPKAIDVAAAGAVDEYEAAKLRVLLRGYHARWESERLGFRVVAVESEFRAPLRNPRTGAVSRTFALGGKMDVLFESSFMEHKTTSQEIGLGSNYWRRLTLDPQISTYYAGAKALGHEVTSCLYDVIRKPGLRPAQVPLVDADGVKIVLSLAGERVRTKDDKKWRETGDTAQGYVLQTRPEMPGEYEERLTEEVAAHPDRYYQRGEVVRLEHEEKEAQFDAWQLARSIRESELSGAHPRNPDACLRYGRVCSYFDVCCSTASLDDASRFQRVDNVHQELSAANEAAE